MSAVFVLVFVEPAAAKSRACEHLMLPAAWCEQLRIFWYEIGRYLAWGWIGVGMLFGLREQLAKDGPVP